MDIVNLYENYNNYFNKDLNPHFKSIFELCSKIAHINNYKIYLIGGIVRDLLLNIANFDIDITVEGNAIEFCKILEENKLGKIISLHTDFGTAKIEIMGEKIDFASTRCETYPQKGHLPIVSEIGCPLECDISRRDFTINSLALSLNKDNFAHLIDYVGGYSDLRNKTLRILHDESFTDDPTRIIRGLKFAVRFGFDLDSHTLELQQRYLSNINYDMSKKRVKKELIETFDLNLQIAFDRFFEQKIYKLISKKELKKPDFNIEKQIKKYEIKHPWIVYIGTLACVLEDDFCEQFELTKHEKNVITGARELLCNEISKDDFELYKKFKPLPLESLVVYSILKDKDSVDNFLNNLSKIKILTTGKELIELGVEPSKAFGEIFDYLIEEKIKNKNLSKTDELNLVKNYISRTQM